MIGLRRTTVSLIATNLQTEGLIKVWRGRVTIVSRELLERRGCECYAVLLAQNRSPDARPALKPLAVPPQ